MAMRGATDRRNPIPAAAWRVGVAFALLAAVPAQAQYAAACPPPKKLAAGACVTACPAGYDDQGRVCVYRNMSR